MRHHLARRQQHAPKTVGIVGVIGRVQRILLKRNTVGDFARHRRDHHVDAELAQRRQKPDIEFRHTHWLEHELTEMSVARPHPKHVVDEVEIDLEAARAVGDRRRGQPARGDVERDVPGVIEPRRQR